MASFLRYEYYCLSTELTFFRNNFTLLLWSRVFSRALGCAAQRGLACTPRRKCRSRPGSVACSGPSKSRNLASNRREVFHPTRAKQSSPWKPLDCHVSFFLSFTRLLLAVVSQVPQQPSKATRRQPRYNSRASKFSLVIPTDGAAAAWV